MLNTYAEEQLADVFYLYGELKRSRRIASAVQDSEKKNLTGSKSDLLDTLNSFVGRGEKKESIGSGALSGASHRGE